MKTFLRELFSCQLGRIRYSRLEWLVMRAGFALAIWFATWHTWKPGSLRVRGSYDMDKANGLPSLIDLSFLGQPGPAWALAGAMAALLALYLSGRWMLAATGGLALIHAVVGGLHHSPAGDHHATQVVGLVLLGQFAWYAREAVLVRLGKGPGELDSASGAVFWSQQLICAGYVVSALSKWANSGGGLIPGVRWVAQLPNIAVQFEKNRLQAYYDKLEIPPGSGLNQAAIELLATRPGVVMAFLAFGFFVELLAFLALWNRAAALLVGLGLMALHAAIYAIMSLPFYYFEAVDLLFFVNLPFWIAVAAGRRRLGEDSL